MALTIFVRKYGPYFGKGIKLFFESIIVLCTKLLTIYQTTKTIWWIKSVRVRIHVIESLY